MRAAGFLLVTLGACSSQVDSYCERTCGKKAVCMPGFDKQACKNECQSASSTVVPLIRSDYLDALLECIRTAECTATDACATKARSAITGSALSQTFCTSYVAALISCGLSSSDQATCVDKHKIYADDVLKRSNACLTRTCVELPSCVTNVLVPP